MLEAALWKPAYATIKGFEVMHAARLQLHTLAYNLANFMRTLALPQEVKQWSLTTLRNKELKAGRRRSTVFKLEDRPSGIRQPSCL